MNEKIAEILKQHSADPASFEETSDTPEVPTGYVPGASAAAAWRSLRDSFSETGLWPIIRGEGAEAFEKVDAVSILRAVPTGSIEKILQTRLEDRRENLVELMGVKAEPQPNLGALAAAADSAGIFQYRGSPAEEPEPWPTQVRPVPSIPDFYSIRDMLNGQLHETVQLSLIPLKHPWEAPAYLGFGNWNECPAPQIQVAVFRNWNERFGAVPACITRDVVECVVAHPPQDEPASMELAAEQWLFCEDIVSQGTQSVRNLAIELWHSPKWFFWWD